MIRGKLNMLIDGQWGSTGKGKLAAWLTEKSNLAVAVCDFQANAGHTVVKDDGRKFVFQQLPVAALYPGVMLLLSAASTIDLPRLLQEIEEHKVQGRLMIHPRATIITTACKTYESLMLKRISSTLKGCGAALGMKTMRHPEVLLAKDCAELKAFIGNTTECLQMYLKAGAMVLMETAQGFDLSVNHGHLYPFVTSRDVTTAAALNNAGVPPQLIGDVYGSIRTYPIRVGNMIEDGEIIGTSGPYYEDQVEIDWDHLASISNAKTSLVERTTVTNKVRRVFTFSELQFKKFLQVCAPNKIFVNFINHMNANDYGKRGWNELSSESHEFINRLTEICRESWQIAAPMPRISHIGTGEKMSDMVELES